MSCSVLRIRSRSTVAGALIAVVMAALPVVTSAPAATAVAPPSTAGTEFWLAVPPNTIDGNPTIELFLAAGAAATGTVSAPGVGFSQGFTIAANDAAKVDLPAAIQLANADGTQDLGLHVTSSSPVTAYLQSTKQYTSEGYVGLPMDALGTRYRNVAFTSNTLGSRLAVVAASDSTTVTVTPKTAMGGHPAGTPFSVSLNQGQTYQVGTNTSGQDATGALITSDKPVGVFGTHYCANVPVGYSACDYLVEQLPPTQAWGQDYLSVRTAARLKGDTYRVVADQDGTVVSVDGSVVATLNEGEFHETVLPVGATVTGSEGSYINTSKPALVAQYGNGTAYDSSPGDPFMMIVPPYQQYLSSYVLDVASPTGFSFSNYASIIAPTAAVGSVTVDGTAVPSGSFSPIPGSTFSGAQVSLAAGVHKLTSTTEVPIGVSLYGWSPSNSYGFPGGMAMAAVASVAAITFPAGTPTGTVGSQLCVSVSAKDSGGIPVDGVLITFTVTGANAQVAYATTDSSGVATACLDSTEEGNGTLSVAGGTISSSTSLTWTKSGQTATPQTAGCVSPPRKIKMTGRTVLQWKTCVTDAGIKVRVQVSCSAGRLVSGRGDITYCRVQRTSRGRIVLVTSGRSLRIRVTYSAKATGDRSEYLLVKTYRT